jgi:hypothetical protein
VRCYGRSFYSSMGYGTLRTVWTPCFSKRRLAGRISVVSLSACIVAATYNHSEGICTRSLRTPKAHPAKNKPVEAKCVCPEFPRSPIVFDVVVRVKIVADFDTRQAGDDRRPCEKDSRPGRERFCCRGRLFASCTHCNLLYVRIIDVSN